MITLTKNEAANSYIFELLGQQGGTCHDLPQKINIKGRTHKVFTFGNAIVRLYIGKSNKYHKDPTVIRGDNGHGFLGMSTVDFRSWDRDIKNDLRDFFLQYIK